MAYQPAPTKTWNRATSADGLLFNDEFNQIYQDIETYIVGNGGAAPTKTMKELNDEKAIDTAVVHNTGNETIAGVKTFSNTTDSTTKDTGCMIAEGGIGVEKNIVNGGYLKAGKGRWPSDNLIGTYIVGQIYDILVTSLPNTNDKMLISGAMYISSVLYIVSNAIKKDSNTISLYRISSSGNVALYDIVHSSSTSCVISLAW